MNRNNIEEDSISLQKLFHILKKNLILFISVIVLVTLAGVGYAKTQKPNYTARETVFFRAQDIKDNNTVNNINIMQAYVETVIDFCDEGVVLDRASYYYVNYKKPANADYTFDEYMEFIEDNDDYSSEGESFKEVDASKIKVYASSGGADSSQKPFSFTVSYTADTREEAVVKVKILVKALEKESIQIDENGEYKYFDGVRVEILDQGLEGVSTNLSTTRTIILFFMLGIVVAVLVVFVKHFLDNTIKTKEELERVTGTNVISVIYTQGGEK